VSAGDVLKLIDLAAARAAAEHAKAASVVTLSFDRVDFTVPVFADELLTFTAELVNVGNSSMVVLVTGSKRDMHLRQEVNNIFRSLITFVALDAESKPVRVPPLVQRPNHGVQSEHEELTTRAMERKVLTAALQQQELAVGAAAAAGELEWDRIEEPWNMAASAPPLLSHRSPVGRGS
jgi:acyl-CoA hydrolase